MIKPKQLNKELIDLTALKEICQNYINFVDNNEKFHEDNEYEYYIFQTAMETLFGKEVWNFVNNRQE